jgi:hypothetical protein
MVAENIKAHWDNLVIEYGSNIPKDEIAKINQMALEEGFGYVDFGKVAKKNVSLGGFYDFLTTGVVKTVQKGSAMDGLASAIQTTNTSLGAKQIGKEIEYYSKEIDKFNAKLELLKTKQSVLADYEEAFRAEIDKSKESIDTYKENILTLKRALEELGIAVTDTYTTIAGKEFAGKDYWEVTVMGMETAMNRFNRYSQLVIKYGGEMETNYMDAIKGMVDSHDLVDKSQLQMLGSLEWYNKEIFDGIDGVDEFGGSLVNVIEVIGEYNQLSKEATAIQKEHSKELDESKRKILELSLAMMEIQLKGMSRRRGLTRTEEKKIQKIQIEQTKERIKQMKWELDEQEKINDLGINDLEVTAEKANAIYQEYVDRYKFAIDDMKDVQNEELNSFLAAINMKEKKIIDYTALYEQQTLGLENALATYIGLLQIISSDSEISGYYEEIYGINALERAQSELQNYMSFLEAYGVTGDISGAQQVLDSLQKVTGITPTTGDEGVTPSLLGTPTSAAIASAINAAQTTPTTTTTKSGKVLPGKWTRLRNFARGIDYIPQDMPIMAHKGEQITPAGKSGSGDTFNVSIKIDAKVASDYDAERLGAQVGDAIERRVLNKKGKSSYRLR